MNDPSSIFTLIEYLNRFFGGHFQTSLFESGMKALLGLVILILAFKVIPAIHKRMLHLIVYEDFYRRFQGWLEFFIFVLILLFFVIQLGKLHWFFIMVFGGAGLLGLGVACRDILSNLLAYPFVRRILSSHIGDSIEFDNLSGKLVKRGLTHIYLEGATGEEITIPNNKILTETFLCSETKLSIYHFQVNFPVPPENHAQISELIEFCRETILLSAYRSLERLPEVGIDLKDGEIWIECTCYTNRKQFISAYRTFVLTEFAEKSNVFTHLSSAQPLPMLKESRKDIDSKSAHPENYKYGDIENEPVELEGDVEPFHETNLENLTLDQLFTEAQSDDPAKASEAIHIIEQRKKEQSTSLKSDEASPPVDQQPAPSSGNTTSKPLDSYTIEEIEQLEDMDLLYQFAMIPDESKVEAAMKAIERLQMKQSEQRTQEKKTEEVSDERSESEQLSTKPIENYTIEEIEQLEDMDLLYQFAMITDETKVAAAVKAIERLQAQSSNE